MQRSGPDTVAAPHGGGVNGSGWLVLVLACAAEFMVVLDASVVNVALPSIRAGLDFTALTLSWVVNSYALVFAGFLLLGGRLADVYGRKRVFLAGVLLFAGSSAVGGLATTPAMLIVARAAQALGAAVLAPASLTILTTTFTEGAARVRALAVWTALASAGGAAGNILGGVLTQYLSWRATLLINVPLGAVALALAARALPDDHTTAASTTSKRGPRNRGLDIPGAVAATVGVTALTWAVTGTRQHGWNHPVTWLALGTGLIGVTVFVACQGWLSPSPLVPLRLFRLRTVWLGNLTMMLAGACLMPMWYFLTLYMQQVLGLSPLLTGLGFLPHTVITVLVGAQLAPRLMAKFPGRTLIIVGALLTAAGFWWQSHITPSGTYLSAVLGPAVVLSIGGGLLNTPLTTTVTSGVTDADAGAASGLMNTAKQVGAGIGLAGLVTTATTTGDPSAPTTAPTAGYSTAFLIMAALMAAVATIALALPARHNSSG